jgi:hypothetical protein
LSLKGGVFRRGLVGRGRRKERVLGSEENRIMLYTHIYEDSMIKCCLTKVRGKEGG